MGPKKKKKKNPPFFLGDGGGGGLFPPRRPITKSRGRESLGGDLGLFFSENPGGALPFLAEQTQTKVVGARGIGGGAAQHCKKTISETQKRGGEKCQNTQFPRTPKIGKKKRTEKKLVGKWGVGGNRPNNSKKKAGQGKKGKIFYRGGVCWLPLSALFGGPRPSFC